MLQHIGNADFFNGSISCISWQMIFTGKGWCLYFDKEYHDKIISTESYYSYDVEGEKDDWCDENIGFNHWHTYNHFWFAFESSADVLAFKLRWS